MAWFVRHGLSGSRVCSLRVAYRHGAGLYREATSLLRFPSNASSDNLREAPILEDQNHVFLRKSKTYTYVSIHQTIRCECSWFCLGQNCRKTLDDHACQHKKNCGEEWLATTVLCERMQQQKQKHFRSLGHVAQECLYRIFLNVYSSSVEASL